MTYKEHLEQIKKNLYTANLVEFKNLPANQLSKRIDKALGDKNPHLKATTSAQDIKAILKEPGTIGYNLAVNELLKDASRQNIGEQAFIACFEEHVGKGILKKEVPIAKTTVDQTKKTQDFRFTYNTNDHYVVSHKLKNGSGGAQDKSVAEMFALIQSWQSRKETLLVVIDGDLKEKERDSLMEEAWDKREEGIQVYVFNTDELMHFLLRKPVWVPTKDDMGYIADAHDPDLVWGIEQGWRRKDDGQTLHCFTYDTLGKFQKAGVLS